MKSILLTGIGNALVDIEFRATDEELVSLGRQKGAMTLTDELGQNAIMAAMGDREHHRCSGGSAANTIIAFGQFGGSAAYMSILGDDAFGHFYANEFTDMGIVLQADRVPGATTGSCLVLITPDSERTLNTTLAVNTGYTRQHLSEELIAASEWLYVEGYKLTEEAGADAVEVAAHMAKKHGGNVAVTCSDGFIINVFGDRLRSILKSADLVFCNESEALALAGEEDVDSAIRALQSRYRNVVVTKGDRGSSIQWQHHNVDVPAFAVKPVDATGAGDMYAGAFLYGVLNRHRPEQAGRLASYAAAQIVSQYGARLKASHIDVRDQVLSSAITL